MSQDNFLCVNNSIARHTSGNIKKFGGDVKFKIRRATLTLKVYILVKQAKTIFCEVLTNSSLSNFLCACIVARTCAPLFTNCVNRMDRTSSSADGPALPHVPLQTLFKDVSLMPYIIMFHSDDENLHLVESSKSIRFINQRSKRNFTGLLMFHLAILKKLSEISR